MDDMDDKECRYCRGTKECPGCIRGDGKMIDRYGYTVDCDVCFGSGKCPWCAGDDE